MEPIKEFFIGIVHFVVRTYEAARSNAKDFLQWLWTIPQMFRVAIYDPIDWWFKKVKNAESKKEALFYIGLVAPVVFIPLGVFIFYVYFVFNAAHFRNLDLDHLKLDPANYTIAAGESTAINAGTDTTRTCGRSAIVDTMAGLIDLNVNQNEWMPASLAYKLGLFGIPWASTPWGDNKASTQLGIHTILQRASLEMFDNLGRVRGSSQQDSDLEKVVGNLRIPVDNWYYGFEPKAGFRQTSWGSYEAARMQLIEYNDRLERCEATFDARADNLQLLMDRIAKSLGSTSQQIELQASNHNSGWFDFGADNAFSNARGELIGLYALIRAARHDFRDIIKIKSLEDIWNRLEHELRIAVELDPLIIANGYEDGFLIPSHLVGVGFYNLRVRTVLVEIRAILDK